MYAVVETGVCKQMYIQKNVANQKMSIKDAAQRICLSSVEIDCDIVKWWR